MKLKMFRCKECGKLIFKFNLNGELEIEVRCPRCNAVTKVRIKE